jgi:hypothetical protein
MVWYSGVIALAPSWFSGRCCRLCSVGEPTATVSCHALQPHRAVVTVCYARTRGMGRGKATPMGRLSGLGPVPRLAPG